MIIINSNNYAKNKSESLFQSLWSGLIGAWFPNIFIFDGTLADLSNNKLHGIFTNMDNQQKTISSQRGNVTNFNGINNYVNLGTPSKLNVQNKPYSINTWIRPITFTDYQNVIFNGSTSAQFGIIIPSTGVWRAQNNTITDTSGGQLTLNNWFNITITFNGSVQKTYQNGRFLNQQTTNNSRGYANNVTIGGDVFNNRYFNGQISELYFYNRVLTQYEIGLFFRNISPLTYKKINRLGRFLNRRQRSRVIFFD